MQGGQLADDLLSNISYSKEAALRIYLGGTAGAGKTYRMLQDGNTLLNRGMDVVIGFVESHGRADTDAQIGKLEIIPHKKISYKGVNLEDMDTDAIIARKPKLVIVDELAHTNIPGLKHEKRYQDIEDILAAGIAVFSTCNVQHLESVYDTVERMTGIEVKERVPDSFFSLAKEIVMVDVSVEELQERLRTGKIYKPEKIDQSLKNFFTRANISVLRELALREVANDVEQKDKEYRQTEDGSRSSEKVLIAISERPDSKSLIRSGSRLAGRLNAKLFVIYVQDDREQLSEDNTKNLDENIKLARTLGASIVQLQGREPAKTILEFAREEEVTHIVLGASERPWWRRMISDSVVVGILRSVGEIAVHVLPLTKEREAAVDYGSREKILPIKLSNYLPEKNIIANLKGMHSVEQVISVLIDRLVTNYPHLSERRHKIQALILQREHVMSTFLESGIAIPHSAGFEEIQDIVAVAALTPDGVSSLGRDQKAFIVLLFLSSEVGRANHLKFLAAIAKIFIDVTTVKEIAGKSTAQDAYYAIAEIENTGRLQ